MHDSMLSDGSMARLNIFYDSLGVNTQLFSFIVENKLTSAIGSDSARPHILLILAFGVSDYKSKGLSTTQSENKILFSWPKRWQRTPQRKRK